MSTDKFVQVDGWEAKVEKSRSGYFESIGCLGCVARRNLPRLRTNGVGVGEELVRYNCHCRLLLSHNYALFIIVLDTYFHWMKILEPLILVY